MGYGTGRGPWYGNLAALSVVNTSGIHVVVHQSRSLNAKPRFQRARGVIDSRMNDPAVVDTLVHGCQSKACRT